jgi:hypothetical protein
MQRHSTLRVSVLRLGSCSSPLIRRPDTPRRLLARCALIGWPLATAASPEHPPRKRSIWQMWKARLWRDPPHWAEKRTELRPSARRRRLSTGHSNRSSSSHACRSPTQFIQLAICVDAAGIHPLLATPAARPVRCGQAQPPSLVIDQQPHPQSFTFRPQHRDASRRMFIDETKIPSGESAATSRDNDIAFKILHLRAELGDPTRWDLPTRNTT